MYYNKIIDIIAYYLSEYDMQAFHFLGYSVQSQGFREISQHFGKKDSYLRRLRDEYDAITSSHRNGQRSEVHHIDYFSTSQNNNANNLIVLCPNHHRLIHKTNPTFNKNEKAFIFANGDVEYILLDYHLDGDK